MDNPPLSLITGAELLPALPGAVPWPLSDVVFTSGCEVDLRLAQMVQTNILLVGPEPALSNVLAWITADGHEAVVIDRTLAGLRLPSPAPIAGPVVLRDVDTLTLEEQFACLQWLTRTGRHVRVISAASRSLLPLVEARAFSAALYYRLNTVCVHLA